MNKDINFDKLAKETFAEIAKNLDDNVASQKLAKELVGTYTKVCKIMLEKYHQELFLDQK